jgi:hypothetical protein
MALPYAFIDSLRHFGKVIPSNSEGTPSSPLQIVDSVGKPCQFVDTKYRLQFA